MSNFRGVLGLFGLELDLKFFHAVSQDWLIRFMEHRIGNRRMIRLIATWLEAGVRPHRSLGKKPPVVFAKKAA